MCDNREWVEIRIATAQLSSAHPLTYPARLSHRLRSWLVCDEVRIQSQVRNPYTDHSRPRPDRVESWVHRVRDVPAKTRRQIRQDLPRIIGWVQTRAIQIDCDGKTKLPQRHWSANTQILYADVRDPLQLNPMVESRQQMTSRMVYLWESSVVAPLGSD